MRTSVKLLSSACLGLLLIAPAQARKTLGWTLTAINGSYVALIGTAGSDFGISLPLKTISWESIVNVDIPSTGGSGSLTEAGAAYDISYVYQCNTSNSDSTNPATATFTSYSKYTMLALPAMPVPASVTISDVSEDGTYNPVGSVVSVVDTWDLSYSPSGPNTAHGSGEFVTDFSVTVDPADFVISGSTCTATFPIPYTDYLGYCYASASVSSSGGADGDTTNTPSIVGLTCLPS